MFSMVQSSPLPVSTWRASECIVFIRDNVPMPIMIHMLFSPTYCETLIVMLTYNYLVNSLRCMHVIKASSYRHDCFISS